MGQVATVFVYADGQVGLRPLDAAFARGPVFNVPVVRPFQSRCADDDTTALSYEVETYTRRGRMSDGRPVFCAVFCADGFGLKWIAINWFLTASDIAHGYEGEVRIVADGQMRALEPNAIILDQRVETKPMTEATHIVEYAARRLVAVRQ